MTLPLCYTQPVHNNEMQVGTSKSNHGRLTAESLIGVDTRLTLLEERDNIDQSLLQETLAQRQSVEAGSCWISAEFKEIREEHRDSSKNTQLLNSTLNLVFNCLSPPKLSIVLIFQNLLFRSIFYILSAVFKTTTRYMDNDFLNHSKNNADCLSK